MLLDWLSLIGSFNQFQANVPILCPLPENTRKSLVFVVFRGYKMGTLGRNSGPFSRHGETSHLI